MQTGHEHTRGILHPHAGRQQFDLQRYPPAPDLAFFVERYWRIQWDLDTPYTQRTLPYPCVNLVIEAGRSGVFGVDTGKFARTLAGSGCVFGVKFKPGGFYPFIKQSVAEMTDHVHSLNDVFGEPGNRVEAAILHCDSDTERITQIESFLRERTPTPDDNIVLINRIVDCIVAEPQLTLVDHLTERFGLSKRSLQRLFSAYVGVSPKWVIQRYRLHESAERLAIGEPVDWTALALDLGYFDQAHFIKDFKAMIGMTPAAYARSITLDRSM
jgi:AraC-like DNA-binding protein